MQETPPHVVPASHASCKPLPRTPTCNSCPIGNASVAIAIDPSQHYFRVYNWPPTKRGKEREAISGCGDVGGFSGVAKGTKLLGVIKAVNGIPIKAMLDNDHEHEERKGSYAICAQDVCVACTMFRNFCVQFQWSFYDSYFWTKCGLRQYLLFSESEDYYLYFS